MGDAMIYISLFLFLLVAGIFFYILITWRRSFRLRVRDKHKNKGYVCDYWVLPKKDKSNGSIWWQSVFFQKKLKIPEPPSSCIDVGMRGRKYVEVWRLSEDEYVYAKDNGISEETILEQDNKKLGSLFKAFSIVQRQVVVDQFVRAEAERNHSFLREHALNLAFGGMMMLIIIIGLIYWGDIGKSMIEQQKASSGFLSEANNVLKTAQGIKTIAPAKSGGVVTPSTEPPSPPK